jgi:hypothetical protein
VPVVFEAPPDLGYRDLTRALTRAAQRRGIGGV